VVEETLLLVRVQPRAARDSITGWRDGVLQVRLRAPPVEGQANTALRRFLAERLGVALSQVEIVRGETSRTKRVRVGGIGREALERRLGLEV
jgi:uncharacterized protein (TIGR00251 family)